MRLYHLTTTPPLSGTALASGSFTGSKKQEIVVASGTHLHLYRRLKSGILHPAISVPVFASIRSLDVFRLPGTSRDYLAVTSDSGSVSVLQADGARATFVSVANETFGRTGMRRTVPGEYMACDPQGRALMVAAVERQKFVYVLARDESNTLQLSSPLEAHRSNNATHSIAALDVGYENPMFAALEMSYEAGASKVLVYYELDLGLNHVVRKLSAPVNLDAFLLIAVPGDEVGPGGLLVCESGAVSYRNLTEEDEQGNLLPRNETNNDMDIENGSSARQKKIRAKLPYRKNDAEREERMIVSAALIKHKNKKGTVFFFMLCTDIGDLIRLELLWDPEVGATEMKLAYFDTLPAPALDMRILRSGYLFALMEGGDSLFLKFIRSDVPENDPNGGFSTSLPINDESMDGSSNNISFTVRNSLTYLSHAESVPSFAPVLGMHSGDFTGEGASQQVMACGRGAGGASLRVKRHGLLVEDRMETLTLNAAANGTFSFREISGEPAHKFLVISFATKTTILRVENEALTEVTDSFGFRKDAATLYAAQMGRDSFVQVHANGVRFVPSGKAAANSEWTPPDGARIVAGTANNAQVLAALSNGDVMYFEMNESGSLAPRDKLEGILAIGGEDEDTNIGAGHSEARPSLALSHVPQGKMQSQFFVVGDGANSKVMVYKLDLKGNPKRVALHLAPAPVSSLALVDFGEVDREVLEANSGAKSPNTVVPHPPHLMLFIGTKHGALVRIGVDYTTGSLGEKRSTFLGPAPISVTAMRMIGVPTCLVMASRPWLFFPRGGSVTCSPLCSIPFQYATPFDTTDIPGFIAVTSNKLRMLCLPAIESIATVAGLPTNVTPAASPVLSTINTTSVITKSMLDATPRRIVSLFSSPRGAGGIGVAPRLGATGVDPAIFGQHNMMTEEEPKGMDLFVVVETDHRMEFTSLECTNGKESPNGVKKVQKRARVVPSKEGRWASQIRLVSVRNLDDANGENGDDSEDELENLEAARTLDVSRLQPDECALCAAASRTMGGSDANTNVSHVVVSVCRKLKVNATGRTGGMHVDTVENELWTYRVENNTRKLEFLHKTVLESGYENSVHAMTAFRDVMVVGIGSGIRLYQAGMKRLLRKGELRAAVRRKVAALCTAGGDRIFIGDVQHSVTICDYAPNNNNSGGTAALPLLSVVARDSLPRWTTSMCVLDYKTVCLGDKFGNVCVLRLDLDSNTDDINNRLSVAACMHVGGTVTNVSFDGAAVQYATAHGAIGALVALESESEHAVVRQVERFYSPFPSLLGRDHTAWRSTFYPVKNVVDGEVCEGVLRERGKDKDRIEKAIGRPLTDIVRVMDELRWKIEAL